jgi:hypothetical protein
LFIVAYADDRDSIPGWNKTFPLLHSLLSNEMARDLSRRIIRPERGEDYSPSSLAELLFLVRLQGAWRTA